MLKNVKKLKLFKSKGKEPAKIKICGRTCKPTQIQQDLRPPACNSTNRCSDTGRLALQDALQGQPGQHG